MATFNTKGVSAWVDVNKWKELFWGGLIKLFQTILDFIESLPWWAEYVFYTAVIGFAILVAWGCWVNRNEWKRCKNY